MREGTEIIAAEYLQMEKVERISARWTGGLALFGVLAVALVFAFMGVR